jgi:hypothetical protein
MLEVLVELKIEIVELGCLRNDNAKCLSGVFEVWIAVFHWRNLKMHYETISIESKQTL